MKEKMTIGELKRYCKAHEFSKILLCSCNQRMASEKSPVGAELVFSKIDIRLNPNLIYLSGGENMVYFKNVRSATVDPAASVLGEVLEIMCGESRVESGETSYTLVLS